MAICLKSISALLRFAIELMQQKTAIQEANLYCAYRSVCLVVNVEGWGALQSKNKYRVDDKDETKPAKSQASERQRLTANLHHKPNDAEHEGKKSEVVWRELLNINLLPHELVELHLAILHFCDR